MKRRVAQHVEWSLQAESLDSNVCGGGGGAGRMDNRYVVMADVVMAYIVLVYIAMAYVLMAYVVMACIATAYPWSIVDPWRVGDRCGVQNAATGRTTY